MSLITLIQQDIIWEDIVANLDTFERVLLELPGERNIVFLPELFTTGFTMRSRELAEPMEGRSMRWMESMARRLKCDIAGSIIIQEDGAFYNRLIWMQSEGHYFHYDKRHLFRMGDENEHYSPGRGQIIVDSHGMRFKPLVCYDLRFPVWSRNRNDYDVLVYIANWPEPRRHVWNSLLQARSLENQAYVIGVNRVGKDGMGISYSGDSKVFNAKGQEVAGIKQDRSNHLTVRLSMDELVRFREKFPVWMDADPFTLED